MVSVVIPCFNASATLARAVASVRNDLAVGEIIVSDDGSKDGSRQVAAGLGGRVRFLDGANGGASSARNRGATAARTEFVHFMDSDDHVDPGYVDALFAATGSDTDVVMGPYKRISTEGEVIHDVSYPVDLPPAHALGRYLLHPTQTGAFLWRRSFLAQIGGWDESLAIYQDAELTMRALLATSRIKVAATNGLVAYWLDNDGASRLSRGFTARKASSTLLALDRHRAAIKATGVDEAVEGLARRYYSLARLSYGNGHDSLGDQALAAYRSLGFRRHTGSFIHRLACELIGLRRKVAVSRLIERLPRRPSGHPTSP